MRFLPIHRIITPCLLLRCWNPTDAPLLLEAIAASLDHLRSWVPWAAHEPMELDAKIRQILHWRSRFDLGRDIFFGIFDHQEKQVLGGVGAHDRIGAGAREIGYWIRADRVRQGLATEAAAAMTRIGFEIQRPPLRRMEIHCDPANIASAGVPRRLGYDLQVTIRRRVPNEKARPRDTMIWTMASVGYASSPAAALELEGFDAAGRRVTEYQKSTSPQVQKST